jgi:DNA-binding transcriptional LysR family regulator
MPDDPDQWALRIGRRLRMRDLEVFLAARRWGSMARAAQHLGITQPAVSKAVRDLEAALSVRLLDRSPQGVTATLYGEVLARRATGAFDELRQGVEEVQALTDPASGRARIGCNESLSVALLPAAIRLMAEERPGVTVSITQMSRPITVEIDNLRERKVDMIVGRGIFDIPEDDLISEILFEEPFVVVAPVHSRWARCAEIHLADLLDEKWILHPPDEAPGSVVLDAFRTRGLAAPHASIITTSFHLRAMLMAAADYLTVIPACMAAVLNERAPTVSVLPVDLGLACRPVAIFTLKNRTLNPTAALFADILRRVTTARLQPSPQPVRR